MYFSNNPLVPRDSGCSLWGGSGSFSNHLTTRNLAFQDLQNVPASTLGAWKTQYINSNGATNPANVLIPNPYQPTTRRAFLPFQGSLAGRTIQQSITLLPYPLFFGGQSEWIDRLRQLQLFSNAFAACFFSSGLYPRCQLQPGARNSISPPPGIEDGQGVNYGGNQGTPDLLNNRLKPETMEPLTCRTGSWPP